MTSQKSPARFAGLDGLRALAVVLVLVYHLFPGSPLHGGFVGVDVFFVISGFLITSLLLRPSRAGALGSRRRLVDFWRRRARRLLPALAVVVTVCATAAWVIGGDVLVGMGRQVLGSATFSYNWLAIADGSDYFAATAPELFRNFWSLAVEEQFYLVWPLLLPLILLIPGRWSRIALVLLLGAGSAVWMAALAAGGDVTRAYFGTDSHAFGILLGIALAFVMTGVPDRPWKRTRKARAGSLLVGLAGVGLIVLAALRPETPDAATFPGALLTASAGSALAIVAGIWPGSWFGRGMDAAPLKWIGDRSYGIYLWHWPVLVLVLVATRGFGPEGGVPPLAGAAALVISLIAAELSYRYVEQPLRRHGFRRSFRILRRRMAGTPRARMTGLVAVTIAAVMLAGTAASIVTAPRVTSAAAAIDRGAQAVEEAPVDEEPSPAAEDPGPITVPAGEQITAIGDSVMLASAPSLMERFPGIAVDAEVSRSVWAGPEILRAMADRGELRENVVVALGTNGPVERSVLQDMARIIGRERTLVLVNAHAPRDWIPGVNAELDSFGRGRPGVWIADWDAAIGAQESLLADDGIHPGTAGGDVFAETVHGAFEAMERERIRAEERLELAPSGRAPRVPFPE
ncbi:acyltransferase family protein [Microbacterium sp. GXF6406]